MPQILTANDLPSGDVVYWNGTKWVLSVRDAVLIEAAPAAEALGAAELAAGRIVDPYLIDVALKDGAPWPTRYREVVRASGPSVRRDLGKQAEI
jgi:Protein of unknown function (DUF2849)